MFEDAILMLHLFVIRDPELRLATPSVLHRSSSQLVWMNEIEREHMEGSQVNRESPSMLGVCSRSETENDAVDYVFVYGTGMGYPVMLPDTEAWTYGELYEVNASQLAELDWLEGYLGEDRDNLYNRVVLSVQTDRRVVYAYVYVCLDEQVEGLPEIKLGDWRVYQAILTERKHWLFFAYGSALDDQRFIDSGLEDEFVDVIGRGTLEDIQPRDRNRLNVM